MRARLKLAAAYGSIIAIIVLGFSAFLYQSTLKNFSDSSEEDFAASSARAHFVSNASDALFHTLLLSDAVIIIIAAGVGYALSKRTLRPVERSHEAQRLFSAHASHELRTPLAIMRNDIEVLLRNPHPQPAEIRSTLRSNLEEIDTMTLLVQDLLLVARSEQDASPVAARLDFTRMVTKAVQAMQVFADAGGVTLGISGQVPVHVVGDEKSLSRVCTNIIQNSLDHTREGGTIEIRISHKENMAQLSITDSGSGIPAAQLPKVFDRFFKGAESSRKGTGLGLSIVKEIITQHGGTIHIASEVGKGTVVTISLPLA